MSRRLGTASFLAAALVIALGVFSDPGLARAQDFDATGEQAMLERINALRAEQELAPVARMPGLDAVARAHSAEMAAHGALAHVSAQTGSPEDRVRNAGVSATGLSENVALHRDAALAHEALLASAPHRGNMLAPGVTHVGIGAVRAEGGTYVTQLFAQLPPAAPLAEVVDTQEAPEDAPAAATPEPEPIFGLIPPFVERVAEQVVGLPAAGAPEPAEVATSGAPSADESPSAAEPSAAVTAEPTSAEPNTAEPTAAGAPAAPPTAAATQNALRQLVDLAQAFLRGPSAAAAPAQ